MKKVTIKDMAKELDLSITQVSKALNGYKDVNADTRARVIKKARELGYVPNSVAKSLASKTRTEIFVLVLSFKGPNVDNFTKVIEGMFKRAQEKNIKIRIEYLLDDIIEKQTLSEYIVQNGIDTPILYGLDEYHKYYKEISSNDFEYNCLALDTMIDSKYVCNVNVDDDKGVQQVAKYFKEKSSNNILVACGSVDSYVNNIRKSSVVKYFNEYDIKYTFIECDFDLKVTYNKVLDMKLDIVNYGAIFCFSDMMALGAKEAINQSNVSIEIVGFDGIDMTDYVVPKISTVSQSFHEKGSLIIDRVTQKDNFENIFIKPEFLKR